MNDPIKNLNDGVLSANVQALVLQSQVNSLRALFQQIAANQNLRFGRQQELSFSEADAQLREEFLNAKLIALEDKNPVMAARLQQVIDSGGKL